MSQLNLIVPKQKITAAEKQKEIEALAANLKERTMNPLTQSKNTTILPVLIALTLACFGLSPQARAVCQEGCLTNENTVLGDDALLNNTGFFNTAIGFNALFENTTGNSNTATGYSALGSNTTGALNTAEGTAALFRNTTGAENTAIGSQTLLFNTTGGNNTATGSLALLNNTTGNSNTANGRSALVRNTTGNSNTATGFGALSNNTTGSNNIALGLNAGTNLTTGRQNIYIGNAGRSGGESRTIRIGTVGTQTATFIAGISGVTVPGGVGVIVGNSGRLGTVASSARFKEAIKPMDKASEAILALKPVTFRYKQELDPDGISQFGLVAEDVEKVNPDLVARDEQGKPYTVRYEAVNAMLLNEFLKEHRKNEEQEATITELKSTVAQQQKELQTVTVRLEQQAAQIQKVSAKVELTKPAPQMVVNDQ
jgi:Chaperone of endosialidase